MKKQLEVDKIELIKWRDTMNTKDSLPIYLFHEGTNSRAYEYMGAHPTKKGKSEGVVFRVWAPNAVSVSVVGDMNGWTERKTL